MPRPLGPAGGGARLHLHAVGSRSGGERLPPFPFPNIGRAGRRSRAWHGGPERLSCAAPPLGRRSAPGLRPRPAAALRLPGLGSVPAALLRLLVGERWSPGKRSL